jgi:hypothetical protein
MEKPPNKDEIKQSSKNTKKKKKWQGHRFGQYAIWTVKEDIDLLVTANIICNLFEKIYNRKKSPKTGEKNLLFKLPKKQNILNRSNWSGITLLSVISKIFSRIIHERITNGIETKLRREQADFKSNRSCIDQINTVRILIEQ